jgi:hypothetical protein
MVKKKKKEKIEKKKKLEPMAKNFLLNFFNKKKF